MEDDWQLEMLCNLAASEFVLPIGSLSTTSDVPPIEDLMRQRRQYDVSAEAFLIRLAKISNQPIGIFVSSPTVSENGTRHYKIDYFVSSPTAPKMRVSGKAIPDDSIVHRCTAIGHTDRAVENWVIDIPTQIECVGLTAYPGSVYPRVAGLVRFDHAQENHLPIRLLHGSVLEPRVEPHSGQRCSTVMAHSDGRFALHFRHALLLYAPESSSYRNSTPPLLPLVFCDHLFTP